VSSLELSFLDTSSSSSEDDAYEPSYNTSLSLGSTSLSFDGVSWDMIVAEGSPESISSIPYTYTSLHVDFIRTMTSGQTNPAGRGATQAPKGKGKEKVPATSSKKGTITVEDPKIVVGSRKSINILFSQRENFKITPQEVTTKTYIVPLDAVNQIKSNPELCDDKKKYKLEENLGGQWSPCLPQFHRSGLLHRQRDRVLQLFEKIRGVASFQWLYPRSPNHSLDCPESTHRGRLVPPQLL
jgi:hypothetical protein